MDKLISIIIPHYNNPQLLKRLLYTIPDDPRIEVIIVDDCSSKHIEEFNILKNSYPDLKWFSTETNGGGGKARNIGIKNASGKYLLFADCDDFFTPFIYELVDKFEKYIIYDVIYFNAISLDSITYKPTSRVRHLNYYIRKYQKNPSKGELYLRYEFGEPWCRLIRTDIIRNHKISFEEIAIHNDFSFCYISSHHAKNILVEDKCLYCVTVRKGSVSKNLPIENINLKAEVFASHANFIKKNRIQLPITSLYIPYVYYILNFKTLNFKGLNRIYKNKGISSFDIIKSLIADLCIRFFKKRPVKM